MPFELDCIGEYFDGRWDEFDGIAALDDVFAMSIVEAANAAGISPESRPRCHRL